ncbi:MAG TPA: cysteine desulfurase [Thermoanaerobaculia bacterium]|nr:cysteine desulfurase [Thermoanaerobaculia bacterium]
MKATAETLVPGVDPALDVEKIRAQFPILRQTVHGKRLVYLDNANTTQKPRAVIDADRVYYEETNANIHRGTHFLSEKATAEYEGARAKVARFLGARAPKEVVFTRGTTEAINLVAAGFATSILKEGDEILVTGLEHHSNIVPWQLACGRTGAKLVVVPITDSGEVPVEEFAKRLSDRTKIAAVSHVSNALGTVDPVEEFIRLARARNVPVLVDGAQAAPHVPIDVAALGCDFYAVSGHKMYGPTGIGALYGTEAWLEKLPPYQGGGDMISSVTFEKTTYNELPWKFEAGTANIAGGIGFGVAADWLTEVGLPAVAAHEHGLLVRATEALSAIEGLRVVGTAPRKAAVVSFLLGDVHPHDIGTILDGEGIAIRTGQHCAQPVMDRYGIGATARASFGVYNTEEEVDALAAALKKVQEVFA